MNISERLAAQITFGLASVALLLGFWFFYIVNPLPFFAYFFDPELAYYLNALQLAFYGNVQLDSHPGTALQAVGASLAHLLSFSREAIFDETQINRFRNVWLFLSLAISLATLWLIYRLANRVGVVLWISLLFLISDYNVFAYWGTFTPEGAFFVLYLPLVIVFLLRMRSAAEVGRFEWCAWGAGLAFVSTIKITLWPVTAFVWSIAYMLRTGKGWGALVLFVGGFWVMVIVSFGMAMAASQDPLGMFSWFGDLVRESGRYGRPSGEGAGPFLSFGNIFEYLRAGLALQNYTLLLALLIACGIAVRDLFSEDCRSNAFWLALLFLGCLGLIWLAFFKHPYQIKYLLPQVLLMVIYWLVRFSFASEIKVSIRKNYYAISILLVGVAFSAFASYSLLRAYSLEITRGNTEQIDPIIEATKPNEILFSLEVLHPQAAKAFALRESVVFTDAFEEVTDTPVRIFRERGADYRQLTGQAIPLPEIKADTLLVTRGFFDDRRAPLIHFNEELSLFFYYAVPAE